MMLSLSVSANAQAEPKELPNGDLIVTFKGKNYLAMPPEKARKVNDDLDELDRLRVALPLAKKEISQLRTAVATAEKLAAKSDSIAAIAEKQRANQERIGNDWKSMYESEKELRIVAEKFVGRGKVNSFFNNPFSQVLTKIGIPVIGMLVSSRH